MHLLNNRLTILLLILIAVLGLGGLAGLSLFNHPCLDDFEFAGLAKNYGVWNFQQFQFLNWSGRYTSTFINAFFNPVIYDPWLTIIKVYPLVFITAFILIFNYFISLFFDKRLKYLQILPFSLVLFICFVVKLESVQELFYWIAGNFAYGIPMLLFLAYLCLLHQLLKEKGTQPAISTLAGIGMLGMVLCGSNELVLVNIVLLNFLIGYYLFYARHGKMASLFMVPFLAIAGAALISLSAPGNLARAHYIHPDLSVVLNPGHVAATFLIAAKYLLLKARHWLFSLPLISASLLLVFLSWKYQGHGALRFKNFRQILVYTLLVFVILLLQLIPVIINEGLPALVDRAVNVIWFHFFLYWLIGLFLVVPFLKEEGHVRIIFSPKLQTRGLQFILLLFLAGVLSSFHIWQTYQDLFFKAPDYDAGLKKRYAYLRQARLDNRLVLEVPPVLPQPQDYPKTLFRLELSPDSTAYYNNIMAGFFKLKSLKLAVPTTPGKP
jgi:hypothetical protein